MFGAHYFGSHHFGPVYFGPAGASTTICVFQLPEARIAPPTPNYHFAVTDVRGVKVLAKASDKIRKGASITGVGGDLQSVTVGDTLHLAAVRGVEGAEEGLWLALSFTGTWVVSP